MQFITFGYGHLCLCNYKHHFKKKCLYWYCIYIPFILEQCYIFYFVLNDILRIVIIINKIIRKQSIFNTTTPTLTPTLFW